MKLTTIEFFKNTPFTDFQNYIHFTSDQERDNFFASGKYAVVSKSTNFNMVKDRLMIRVQMSTIETYGVNYCRWYNDFDQRYYYAYVMTSEYVNYDTIEFGLVLDLITTFCQGNFAKYINNPYVFRQSLTTATWNQYKNWLSTNSDTLVFPKTYTYQKVQRWLRYYVIFTCSVDLKSDFGDEDNPKLVTSDGQTYDGIVSPVNLYCAKAQGDFTALMNKLKDYPWIAQNIKNVAIVPAAVVDDDDLTEITGAKNDGVNASHICTFKNNGKTKTVDLDGLRMEKDILKQNFDFDTDIPDWVMREQYANIEMDDWAGQSVSLDPAFLPVSGLRIVAQAMFGYHNEIRVIPDQYKSSDSEPSVSGLYRGSYANSGIIFKVFDDIPVLVDNYKLSYASTAHQRQLANSRTITGRIDQITNPNTSLQDKFYNAVSLTTGLAGGVASHALSQFNDEYEYYRTQKAELADKAISAPSVGEQNNSQSFNMSAGIFGVTLKFSSIGTYVHQVIRYHNTFGFDFGGQLADIESIYSMPKMNFLKVDGNLTIPDMPAQFVQQLKATLQNGVKLWHNNGMANPFIQRLDDNMANE